ncbi:hypothetical protein AVDCRST_MAG84-5907 [uncultured Microcoleus sp.]|uniref:Uncharacterized protein n=1 Tax=uncultured Microcoleus sp. TaxID=259945 RepID=A0A6J4NTX1_9CYAN|nr:hypothetical protein AVDCRST_MAG84-5907 [uncultured Microcoleus sp.]
MLSFLYQPVASTKNLLAQQVIYSRFFSPFPHLDPYDSTTSSGYVAIVMKL